MTDHTGVQTTTTLAFCSVEDFRRISGMGRTTIFQNIAAGNLPARKLGRRTLIDVAAGLAWMRALPTVFVNKAA